MTQDQLQLPEHIHTVALGLGDLNGIMRGKRIPASQWPRVCKSGTALSAAMFVCDAASEVLDDTPIINMECGYPDMHLFPSEQVYEVPWEAGCGFCFGQAGDHARNPIPLDPRGVLVEQIERARGMGFDPFVGTELEFYLLDPETLQPTDIGNQFYGLARAAELEYVVGPIRRDLSKVGIPIEQSNPEYAAGQVEVNIRYGPALQAADQVVAFRSFVKDIARTHGLIATFMSKPFIAESGNGFHTHYSLWKDGKNVFAGDDGTVSAAGKQFLAGMQSRMVETALVSATTPNAYRRRQPYSFCPTNNCWGFDNRTVGLRVITESPEATRVEKRDGSADCNPYYLIATELAAGLDGIDSQAEAQHFTETDAYAYEEADALPTDLPTALQLGRESEFLTRVLGADRLAVLVSQAEREINLFANQVTPAEIDRYLRNF